MHGMPAVVHNLEARDDDFINYILSNISIGNSESRFLYDKTSNTTATVYGYAGNILSDSITIPEQIDGLTINCIAGDIFANKGNINSIILPNSLKTIKSYAFAGLENLTTITFAGSGQSQLEEIGYGAFTGCVNLNKFNSTNAGNLALPNTVISVNNYAFYRTAFSNINIGSNVNYIGEAAFSNIIDIDNGAFIDCPNLEKIVSVNGTLPDVGDFSFVEVGDSFKFYCRKALIDNLSPSSNWYRQSNKLEPIATQVYFEDLNTYETFYYGNTVALPSEEIEGMYNKGWLRVNENSNQTYGSYLTPGTWNETVATATYRADLLLLKAYTIYVYNGEAQILARKG